MIRKGGQSRNWIMQVKVALLECGATISAQLSVADHSPVVAPLRVDHATSVPLAELPAMEVMGFGILNMPYCLTSTLKLENFKLMTEKGI